MLTGIITQIERIDSILATLPPDEKLRSVRVPLGEITRQLAEATVLGRTIPVGAEHERYAIEAVTAYIDGASLGDGYSLLGETIASGFAESEGTVEWVTGVIGALSRLAGDLAVLHASLEDENHPPSWERALKIIQRFARPEK